MRLKTVLYNFHSRLQCFEHGRGIGVSRLFCMFQYLSAFLTSSVSAALKVERLTPTWRPKSLPVTTCVWASIATEHLMEVKLCLWCCFLHTEGMNAALYS